MQLLAQGEYELGWRLWESRPISMGGRPEGKPSLSFPEWDGRAIRSLLILPEQGLGDQIMFARYAPFLREQGVEVSIMCHPRLMRLFTSLGVPVLSALGRVELPAVDAWALGPSMPYLCQTTLENIPRPPYLSAHANRLGGIGVMVRGNPAYTNDITRSLDADSASDVLRLPGAVDLSPEATGARDFQDTAEIIAGLDLVISVDTAVAHLAGAMGKRTCLLLPHHADWRWMTSRHDSPWYPSVTLFRQPSPGNWRAVIEAMTQSL